MIRSFVACAVQNAAALNTNIVERSKHILLEVGATPIMYLMIALSVVSRRHHDRARLVLHHGAREHRTSRGGARGALERARRERGIRFGEAPRSRRKRPSSQPACASSGAAPKPHKKRWPALLRCNACASNGAWPSSARSATTHRSSVSGYGDRHRAGLRKSCKMPARAAVPVVRRPTSWEPSRKPWWPRPSASWSPFPRWRRSTTSSAASARHSQTPRRSRTFAGLRQGRSRYGSGRQRRGRPQRASHGLGRSRNVRALHHATHQQQRRLIERNTRHGKRQQ